MLSISNLTISFPSVASAELAAVRDVSFTVQPGEVVAIVGESGSGKSLTALAMMGLLPGSARAGGSILFEGRELIGLESEAMRRLRGREISMIFQEPMTALNPVMRVGEQVAEAARAHGTVIRGEAQACALAAMREAGLSEPQQLARNYPHQLSGGMRQRVMIAMAIVNRPKLLIADEPTTALDVTTQAQVLALLSELRAKLGLAIIFISHDLALVAHFAARVVVMYAGSVVEMGSAEAIFRRAMHPYTRGLLRAMPNMRSARNRPLPTIEGGVPALGALPPGCAFEPRCGLRVENCRRQLPPLVEVAPGHWARCPVTTAVPTVRASAEHRL